MWCCFLSLSLCGKAQISRNLFFAFRFSAKLYRLLSITGKGYEGWGKFSRPFPDVANDSRGAVYFIVHGALQFKYWAAFLDLIWIIGGNWNRFSFLTFVGIEMLRFWAVSNLLLILHSELFLHSRGTFSNSRDLFSSLMKYSDKNSPKHNLMNPEGCCWVDCNPSSVISCRTSFETGFAALIATLDAVLLFFSTYKRQHDEFSFTRSLWLSTFVSNAMHINQFELNFWRNFSLLFFFRSLFTSL